MDHTLRPWGSSTRPSVVSETLNGARYRVVEGRCHLARRLQALKATASYSYFPVQGVVLVINTLYSPFTRANDPCPSRLIPPNASFCNAMMNQSSPGERDVTSQSGRIVTLPGERFELTQFGRQATEAHFFCIGILYTCGTIHQTHLRAYASRDKSGEADKCVILNEA